MSELIKSNLSEEAIAFKNSMEAYVVGLTEEGFELVDSPLKHEFTNGLYIREVFMQKGLRIVTKVHRTNHPFMVSKGKVLVGAYENGEYSETLIEAPYKGITQPGTFRILYIIEDCTWTTYHPLPMITGKENELKGDELDKLLEEIEIRLFEPHDNPLLPEEIKKQKFLTQNRLS